jgi:hypothetical protein
MADPGTTVAWALTRLRELRGEYAGGEAVLIRIERNRAQIQESMLRVAGAIQVLEELVAVYVAAQLRAIVRRWASNSPAAQHVMAS